jgi:hypothetical protein
MSGVCEKPSAANIPIEVGGSLTWQKLSPAEFQQLQDYMAYSNKRMSDALEEFEKDGKLSNYNTDGEIDYAGFKLFMDIFLEMEAPEDLCQHLFLSFMRPSQGNDGEGPKTADGSKELGSSPKRHVNANNSSGLNSRSASTHCVPDDQTFFRLQIATLVNSTWSS